MSSWTILAAFLGICVSAYAWDAHNKTASAAGPPVVAPAANDDAPTSAETSGGAVAAK